MDKNRIITAEDIHRIATHGPKDSGDEKIVRAVFSELLPQPSTVGALTAYQKEHVVTVRQLFDFVKVAPSYMDAITKVGAAYSKLYLTDLYRYKAAGYHREYYDVWTIDKEPENTKDYFLISTGDDSLYDGQITFTTYPQHAEGYADGMESLYRFSCIASRELYSPIPNETLSLRQLIYSLQSVMQEDPDKPVILKVTKEDYAPLMGVCWIEEDDTVVLRYGTYFRL